LKPPIVLTDYCHPLLNWLHVSLINLDGGGSLDQIKGDNESQAVFPANYEALEALERPGLDAHAVACGQEGMWLGVELASQPGTQGFHLLVGERRGQAAKSNQLGHSGHQENSQAIAQRQMYENVSGKEGHLELNSPITPTPDGTIERQKALDTAARNFGGGFLLMVCRGVSGVPKRLRIGRKPQMR